MARQVKRRAGSNCAGPARINVPAPRDVDRWTTSRIGVGRRARVDPYDDVGAHTVGPACPAQSGCTRKAPRGRSAPSSRGSKRPGLKWCAPEAGCGRAADTSRPSAAVMGRAASVSARAQCRYIAPGHSLATAVLPTVETSPPLMHVHAARASGAGRSCPQPPIETRGKRKMSVSEWLTTRERTNMDNRMTDAEIAAQWAAQALTEGRYDLGRALANIAAQAAQTGARLVPMIGQTRNETPDRAQDAATELLTLPQHAPGPY